ncbi:2963_t:CDS:1, partial [Racocetra persica]
QNNIQIINSYANNNNSKNINSNDIDNHNIEPNHNDQNNDNYDNKQEKFSESAKSDYSDRNEEVNIEDLIRMLFERVFVNNSWICVLLIENLYYLAVIYPDICYNCSGAENLKTTKDEQSIKLSFFFSQNLLTDFKAD